MLNMTKFSEGAFIYLYFTNKQQKSKYNSTHVGMMLERVICLNCLLAIQASDTLMQLVLKYTPEEKKEKYI